MSKVFGITGWKDSGKTTMVASLVKEFTRRGMQVSTIKHAHDSFSIDREGTDSDAHRKAGAQEVALVSSKRWALMHEVSSSGAVPSLETMLAKLAPCDLVLVEGYKNSDIPKIECIRVSSAREIPIWKDSDSILAIATDEKDPDCDRHQFDLGDIDGIADYIAQIMGMGL